MFALAPSFAVSLGLHEYDGRLSDLSREATDRWAARADELLGRLRALSTDELPADRRYDHMLLQMKLESPLFDLRDSRDFEQNPMVYLAGLSLNPYIAREYAPLTVRADAMRRHLAGVPDFLRRGLARLDPEVPAPYVRFAVGIARGIESNFRDAESVVGPLGDAVLEPFRAVRDPAVAAVQSFATRLEQEWLPRATQEFALGPERYQKLLWVRERIRAPFSDMLAAGRADLARNQARLREIAAAAQPPTDGPGLLRRAATTHPTADQLVPRARDFVEETRRFVREKELVTIPEPAVCRVEETPIHNRALTTASLNPPGPFDTSGGEGIYYVTPIDPAWSATTQEEWLRSFNDSVLRNVTVHEVYPGHYLQFLHLRRSASSLTRKTSMSNAFVEGWAHYAEQLAVEQGLGAGAPEAEAAQLFDALLRDCRLIVSVGLHTQGMTLPEATAVFQREGYCEPIVAQREAGRGTYDPDYFGYTVGKLAILDARRKHLAPRFGGSLRAFHDRLLGFGAPPVGFLDDLLQAA